MRRYLLLYTQVALPTQGIILDPPLDYLIVASTSHIASYSGNWLCGVACTELLTVDDCIGVPSNTEVSLGLYNRMT